MAGLVEDPYSADRAAIARKRALAQALQQQAMTPMGTQQVGGLAVRNSPLQGAAQLVQALMSKQGMEGADTADRALQGQIQQRRGADMALISGALGGRQASPGGLQEDASGNVTPTDPVKALNPVQSLQQALPMIQDPQLQQFALQQVAAQQPKRPEAFTLKPGDVRYDESGRPVAFGDVKDPSTSVTPTTVVGPDGKPQIIDARTGRVIGVPPTDKPTTPYFSPVGTPQGVMAFDARTGKMTPVQVQGAPVVRSGDSPQLQGDLAAAKAGGKERGESQAAAQIDLQRVVDNASNAISIIDQMIGPEGADGVRGKPHPGFSSAVGMRVPGLGYVPGTETANFNKLLDQVKGGAFLEAFNSLKGGGQITEVEGKKATEAITRMNNAQSEREFIKAAREYQGIIRQGVARAQAKAGQTPQRRSTDAANDPLGIRAR